MSEKLREIGLEAWGPIVEDPTRLRSEQAVALVAARRQLPLDAVADALLESELRHRYLVLARLARTSRTTVLAAVDLLLAREVAIKIHHEEGDEDAIYRSLAEARMMSRVEHPNLVHVLDAGEYGGRPYVVMELCDTDLAVWSAGKPWTEVVDRILEVGAGLEALHDAGLVHADVKPANILIQRGVAKLGDFDLAGVPGVVCRISGTAGFIAPEAADGLRAESGDVFGLACSAWYCLFGASPFGAPPRRADASSAVMVLVERARGGELELPSTMPQGLPLRLVHVLRAGLLADPRERPSLRRWLSGSREVRGTATRGWFRNLIGGRARP